MKKLFPILSVLFLIFLISGCTDDSAADSIAVEEKGIPVKTISLQPGEFSEFLNITGTVKARNRIQILVEEGGLLDKIIKDKGRFARSGDTLAILDNKILKASYDEMKAALRQAELDYNSKKVLFDQRAISENEYLASKYGYERALAGFDLTAARYSKLFITAPINGYVNERFYDIGAYARPMTPIFDFIDNAYMKVSAGVAERFLDDIQLGTPAEITFDAFPKKRIKSKVSFKTQSIDPLNRTFLVEIQIPNPKRDLAPQMIANVKLLRRAYKDKIIIPLDAVIQSETGRYVFISKGDKAHKIPVKLSAVAKDSALVEGLSVGQELVVVGQQELTDGDPLLRISE